MDFVGEFVAVDGRAAAASARWVAPLDHKRGDYTVEGCVGVVVSLGQGGEVFTCLCLFGVLVGGDEVGCVCVCVCVCV
jgi:hypothetical protein